MTNISTLPFETLNDAFEIVDKARKAGITTPKMLKLAAMEQRLEEAEALARDDWGYGENFLDCPKVFTVREDCENLFDEAAEEILETLQNKANTSYHIKHEKGAEYWSVYYGVEWVVSFRAKSRSKYEIKQLITHMNKQLED